MKPRGCKQFFSSSSLYGMKQLKIILTLPLFLFSCDTIYYFGEVKNVSQRTVLVVLTDKKLKDHDLYLNIRTHYRIAPTESSRINSGLWPPNVPPDHVWYFDFFDIDTLNKYRSDSPGVAHKAFVWRDSITQQQLLDRHVSLQYSGAVQNSVY